MTNFKKEECEYNLSQSDVARMFGVQERTIARWYELGKLPLSRIRMNGIIRYSKVECEAWLMLHKELPKDE